MPEKKKKSANLSSLIGGAIMLLVVAGGPILSILRRIFGSTLNLPSSWLPLLIGALVILSMLVSAGRAIGNATRRRGDARLPTYAQPPTASAPRPPFEQASSQPRPIAPASAAPMPFDMPGRTFSPSNQSFGQRSASVPVTPRFDPIINPVVLVVGLVGLLVLAGAAFVLLG